jgi:hypothetical protein
MDSTGYKYFPGFFSSEEVEKIRAMIDNKRVNYVEMDVFITDVFLKKVSEKLNWNAYHTKYRVSNNNNSSDASVLHRDVIKIKNIPFNDLYTCLTYLDKAKMEIVPGSHEKIEVPLLETITGFYDKKIIEMNPGDVLVFNANMLHRGIFDHHKMSDNRRLIQVFETYISPEEYKLHNEKVLHIKSSGVRNASADVVNYLGHIPVISDLLSYISYLNASTGYGQGTALTEAMAKHKLSEYSFMCSEGMQKRLDRSSLDKGWGDSNLYVFHSESRDMPEEAVNDIIFISYTKWLAIYSFMLLLLVIIIFVIFYKVFARGDSSPSTKVGL